MSECCLNKDNMFNLFKKSVFAGLCISIGCVVYLSVGGTVGACLFSFGLLSIINYSLPLYTGKSGFLITKKDLKQLPLILIGNIVGAFFVALLIKSTKPDIVYLSDKIVKSRIELQYYQIVCLSAFCGIIMTIVVKFAKNKNFIPLFFGIPLFILSGFIHSIADAFYFSVSSITFSSEYFLPCLLSYICAVFGNFIGCVIPNVFIFSSIFIPKSNQQ